MFGCMYVCLTMFYEGMKIHTYNFSFGQFGVCTTSKLKFHVCLSMQAMELYNQHGKSMVFSKPRNLEFHGRGHVSRRKQQKSLNSELRDVVYGCLDVNFADAGHGNGPSLHTYTDRCRFREGRCFHVCLLLPMQAEENVKWTKIWSTSG